ncbi:MAG: hypothetical protein RPR28_06235 [Cycloclasticus sp.]|nr:hypothetical protein A9Q80_01280 [Cycloclasticus sp. 46_83_sub15_T18]
MVKVKIPKPYQLGFFSLLAISWTSGLMFFILKTWFVAEGDYGLVKHAWQFPALQIHGLGAFMMMMSFGFLLASHISACWEIKRKRKSGLGLIALFSFLIITAYLLYYIVEGSSRELIAYAHLAVGFSVPFVLLLHIFTKVRSKRAKLKRN